MNLSDAIRSRTSVKKFAATPVARDQIEALLDLAVLAPNHRMSAPWRFLVLGPEARSAYGHSLGVRKSRKLEDPEAARAVIDRTVAEAVAVPTMIAVVQRLSDNPETLEEDYAATWMAIQNILLGATDLGLGTHLRTGAVLGDAGVRQPWGVGEGERIVGLVLLGHPEGEPTHKPRVPAAERTEWRA